VYAYREKKGEEEEHMLTVVFAVTHVGLEGKEKKRKKRGKGP